MQVGRRGSEKACDFRAHNPAPYLHCPSYQLSRRLRQDSPSGSRDGHLVAVCLGSSPWFGSCIHNSPCRYKSHCRRPAFACSPFHRSLSTERGSREDVSDFCCGNPNKPPPSISSLPSRGSCRMFSLISRLKPSSQATAGSVRHSPNWGFSRQGPQNPSFSGAPREGYGYSHAIKLTLSMLLRPCQKLNGM